MSRVVILTSLRDHLRGQLKRRRNSVLEKELTGVNLVHDPQEGSDVQNVRVSRDSPRIYNWNEDLRFVTVQSVFRVSWIVGYPLMLQPFHLRRSTVGT